MLIMLHHAPVNWWYRMWMLTCNILIGADSRLRTYVSFCTREGLYLKLYQRCLYLRLPCFVLAYAINRVMDMGANRGFEPLYCTAQYTYMRSSKRKFGTGYWSRTNEEISLTAYQAAAFAISLTQYYTINVFWYDTPTIPPCFPFSWATHLICRVSTRFPPSSDVTGHIIPKHTELAGLAGFEPASKRLGNVYFLH